LNWANKHGGIYRINLGAGTWIVVVSDPIVAGQLLGRGPGSLPHKAQMLYRLFDVPTFSDHPSFFTTSDDEHWRTLRKGTAPAFTQANIR
jgi:cytochrome P450